MLLHEYLNVGLLAQEIEDGYVTIREHPDDGALWILNYSKKTQTERRWNDATEKCRGLIVKAAWWSGAMEVIARPFEKFYNLSEHPEGAFNLDAPVWATDKADGSLSILYPSPDGNWAIATRGSFTSEQAVEGTKMLRERIAEGFSPREGVTYLFEVIYPENRIVLDYGSERKLVLLDALVTDSVDRLPAGEAFIEACDWFERAEGHRSTLRKLLESPDRPNAEGYVAYTHDGRMVKVKQEDYVQKHRMISGLSEIAVWEAVRDGTIVQLANEVPEEIRPWLIDVWQRLNNEADKIRSDALNAATRARAITFLSRRDLALWVKATSDEPDLTFALLDGKDITPSILRRIRPKGASRPQIAPREAAA